MGLHNVKLKDCCIKAIDDLNRVIRSANLLKNIVLPASVMKIFAPGGHSAGLIVDISSEDFKDTLNAMKAVDKIAKKQCKKICRHHEMDHMGTPGNIGEFWKQLGDTFV